MYSSELKGYLTGLIIGDGFIDSGITKRAFSIKSIDKNFIDKIYDDLTSCTDFKISIKFIPEHFSCGCNHKDSWELRIRAHPYFNKKYNHFYTDYKKRIVSKEASSWLTPQGIANWYMSDGYVCHVGKTKGHIYNRRIDFCTDRYDLNSIHRLQKALLNYGIETSLSKRNTRYRIRIKTSSYERFIMLVEPYMVESMKYKLWLGYYKQPKWMTDECWEMQKRLSSASTQTSDVVG
jgi:hypothetical protein